jgi:hypothetical protein
LHLRTNNARHTHARAKQQGKERANDTTSCLANHSPTPV